MLDNHTQKNMCDKEDIRINCLNTVDRNILKIFYNIFEVEIHEIAY